VGARAHRSCHPEAPVLSPFDWSEFRVWRLRWSVAAWTIRKAARCHTAGDELLRRLVLELCSCSGRCRVVEAEVVVQALHRAAGRLGEPDRDGDDSDARDRRWYWLRCSTTSRMFAAESCRTSPCNSTTTPCMRRRAGRCTSPSSNRGGVAARAVASVAGSRSTRTCRRRGLLEYRASRIRRLRP